MTIELTKPEANFLKLWLSEYKDKYYGSYYPRSAGWDDVYDSLEAKLKGGESNDEE